MENPNQTACVTISVKFEALMRNLQDACEKRSHISRRARIDSSRLVSRNVSQVGRPFPYMLRSSSCADYRSLGTGASVFDWASPDVSIELRT